MSSVTDLVVVCDDLDDRRQAWMEAVTGHVGDLEVLGLDKDSFTDSLGVLESRRREARANPLDAFSGECVFDRARMLFVDFDLIDFDESVTGDVVSYLARCYSTCGTIVGLNQFGESPFDLTLIGHPDSFADLNLGGRQLSNPGLWDDDFIGFRPWSWPLLRSIADSFEQRSIELVDRLEQRVLEYFGLATLAAQIPRASKEYLGVTQKAEDVTFESFVRTSGKGLHRKDSPSSREAVARIAAARLSRWLERLVLAGQDLVVDAPHLALRVPQLLSGDRAETASWDATTTFDVAKLSSGLQVSLLSEFEFAPAGWLSRPAWYWPQIRDSDQIRDLGKSLEDDDGYVFCEDLSRFLPRDAAREFVSDVASPYVRRFALDLESPDGIAFLERERSRDGWDDEATDPAEMNYRPAVRFAL